MALQLYQDGIAKTALGVTVTEPGLESQFKIVFDRYWISNAQEDMEWRRMEVRLIQSV